MQSLRIAESCYDLLHLKADRVKSAAAEKYVRIFAKLDTPRCVLGKNTAVSPVKRNIQRKTVSSACLGDIQTAARSPDKLTDNGYPVRHMPVTEIESEPLGAFAPEADRAFV